MIGQFEVIALWWRPRRASLELYATEIKCYDGEYALHYNSHMIMSITDV